MVYRNPKTGPGGNHRKNLPLKPIAQEGASHEIVSPVALSWDTKFVSTVEPRGYMDETFLGDINISLNILVFPILYFLLPLLLHSSKHHQPHKYNPSQTNKLSSIASSAYLQACCLSQAALWSLAFLFLLFLFSLSLSLSLPSFVPSLCSLLSALCCPLSSVCCPPSAVRAHTQSLSISRACTFGL